MGGSVCNADQQDNEEEVEAVPVPSFHKLEKGKDSYKSEAVEKDYKLLHYPLPHMFR
jgi:hypothetical protein